MMYTVRVFYTQESNLTVGKEHSDWFQPSEESSSFEAS